MLFPIQGYSFFGCYGESFMNKKVFGVGLGGAGVVVLSLFFIFSYLKKKQTHFCLESPEKNVKKVVLANGLTVLLFKTSVVPKVFMQMTYRVGAAVEAADERGIAHVVEHMTYKGTKQLSEGALLAIARRYGAYLNGQTSWDFTRYFFEVVKSNWRPFIPLFADLMHNVSFDAQCFASEIKAIFQELNAGKDASNRVLADRMFEFSFPANHPYHFSIIGYKDELARLTVERLRRFYEKYYQPQNAVFFMMGDFDFDEALSVIRQNFEQLQNTGPREKIRPFPTVVPQCSAQYMRFSSNVRQRELACYWLIPGIKDEDEVIPSLLESLLYERFYKILVKKNAVASGVSTRTSKQVGAGVFMVMVRPEKGLSDKCYTLITQELRKIIKEGFSDQEINTVLKNKERIFYERMVDFKDFAYVWSKSYLATGDEHLIFKRPHLYRRGAKKQLEKYVEKYLNPLLTNRIEVVPLTADEQALSKKIKKKEDALEKRLMKDVQRVTAYRGALLSKKFAVAPLGSVFLPKPDSVLELRNGLQVFLCQRGQLPLLSVDICLRDREFLSGTLEGVLVDLMFKTLFDTSKQSDDFFKSHGVSLSVGGSGVRLAMLHEGYEDVFKYVGLLVANPRFSQDILDKHKKLFIHFFERSKGKASVLVRRTIKQLIYQHHPYGWSFDDAIALIKKTTRADVIALHKKYVTAHGMVAAIVGSFDLDHMQHVIKRSLAVLSQEPYCAQKVPKLQKQTCSNRDIALANNLVLQALYAPSLVTVFDHDLVSLKLLSKALFYRQGSRLFSVRERYGLFYGGFGGLAEGVGSLPGFDYVGSNFSVDKLKQAELLLRNMIHEVGLKGITEDELEASRQLYFMDVVGKLSSNKQLASLYTYLYSMGLSVDYFNDQLKRAAQNPLKEVNRVAEKHLRHVQLCRVRIGRV